MYYAALNLPTDNTARLIITIGTHFEQISEPMGAHSVWNLFVIRQFIPKITHEVPTYFTWTILILK